MNWYMLWQLSRIKQSELLNEASNHRKTAKRRPKPKMLSYDVKRKLKSSDPKNESRLVRKAAFCISDKPVTVHPGSSNPWRSLW